MRKTGTFGGQSWNFLYYFKRLLTGLWIIDLGYNKTWMGRVVWEMGMDWVDGGLGLMFGLLLGLVVY